MRAISATALFAVLSAAQKAPHIVVILADDLGWGDLQFTGVSDIRTPAIDALLAGGMRLTRYYTQPVCSPSRAALHTGRYPLAYGLQTYVIDPAGVDYGLNLNETTLPELLRDRGGYDTHAIGKWHMGMARWEQTPTFRGYNSFHGYYSGGQDYYTHTESNGFDLHLDATPRCGANCSIVDWPNKGRYSTELYASAAVARIAAHDPATPLFLYVAFQAVHAPDQVPQSYIDPYNATIADAKRRIFAGMLSALDEGVANITAALRARGMGDNTLIVFAADNGGPIRCDFSTCGDATGTSNYPLRGGKHSLWEGGVRVSAVASGAMLASTDGSNHTGLMHVTDWLPTLLEAAGVAYAPAPGFELHGVSQWASLTTGAPSPRNETICNIDPLQPAVDNKQPPGAGNAAIVTADGWKLQLGLTGPPWDWSPANLSATAVPPPQHDVALDADGARAAPGTSLAATNCSAAPIRSTCLPGNDIVSGGVAAATPAACCARCSARGAACVAWTWRASQSTCYVKSAVGAPVSDPDCVSSTGGVSPPLPLWPLKNMTAVLFNLTTDPYERYDVAAAHPEVVAQLTARLAQWGERAVTPLYYHAAVDPLSPPALRNGTWTPWLP